MGKAKDKKAVREVPLAHLIAASTSYFSRVERLRALFFRTYSWLTLHWGPDFEVNFRKTFAEDAALKIQRLDPHWVASVNVFGDLELFREHWVASLFVAVDGYQKITARENSLKDPAISKLLNSKFTPELKDFRDIVYHFDPEYYF